MEKHAQMGDAEQKAFEQIKISWAAAPVRQLPDFYRPLGLTTDTSIQYIGTGTE